MLLPNQQKKALFRLSVESAGGANVKRRFQNRLFCMKNHDDANFPVSIFATATIPFWCALPKHFCKNFKLTTR